MTRRTVFRAAPGFEGFDDLVLPICERVKTTPTIIPTEMFKFKGHENILLGPSATKYNQVVYTVSIYIYSQLACKSQIALHHWFPID